MPYLEDHGLPLGRFKEYRRELVVVLTGSKNLSQHQIALIQDSIAAIEAMIGDLDAEVASVPAAPPLRLVHSVPARNVLQRSFGRRRA
jgi:hypothetical protein